jgi:hypothetical protein
MTDMLVKLYALPDLAPALADPRMAGVTIRRALTPEKHVVVEWVRATFDSPGWAGLTHLKHDYDPSTVQQIYTDALEAWRKNPIAWRIIAIVTDYVVGDRFAVSSRNPRLNRFIREFWNHPKNRMPLRLESMCDELSRAGDLFVLLFRNPQDGMSYVRFVTKDRIQRIVSAENDWETELAYHEVRESGEARVWLSPEHPAAPDAEAVMLHYAVNRPIGALLGESDLTTVLTWLLRYSRLVEDRVRLHWAARSFLWEVTVPAAAVQAKAEQYRQPPESGSIIVHDEAESWRAVNPNLAAADARHDMQAVRAMIDAGSGFPPHWRGDASDISLATAQAMTGPTERHLTRRQNYFKFVIADLLHHAYRRAAEVGAAPRLASADYDTLFTFSMPDISRFDNQALAQSARDLTQAYCNLAAAVGGVPESLQRPMLRAFFQYAGVPVSEEAIETMIAEMRQSAPPETQSQEDPPNDHPTANR